MGDAVIVAVPMISVMAVAVALIVWGSRRNKAAVTARKAPWRVGTEPDRNGSIRVFLTRDGHRDDERMHVGTVSTDRPDWEDWLIETKMKAEQEALHLNLDL